MHTIRITYDIRTPESAEHGDYAESGWVDEVGESMEPDEYEQDEGISVIDKTVEYLQDHSAIEPSEAGRGASPRWWTDYEYDEDFRTGRSESRSYHLTGYSETERQNIYRMMRY
jgi:hypothetical protein